MTFGENDAFVFPIIDSVETLAYASAFLNPMQEGAISRLTILPEDDVPALEHAVRAVSPSANKVFVLQLQAIIDGWTALLDVSDKGGGESR